MWNTISTDSKRVPPVLVYFLDKEQLTMEIPSVNAPTEKYSVDIEKDVLNADSAPNKHKVSM